MSRTSESNTTHTARAASGAPRRELFVHLPVALLALVLALSAGCGGATVSGAASAEVTALLEEGQRYERGLEGPYDIVRARAAYQRACARGAQRGCAMWGFALTLGPSAQRDFERAAALTRAACDAGDLLKPDAQWAAEAMKRALSDAALKPAAVGYVNAHGTGTVLNDVAEAAALGDTFGDHLDGLPVSSTKPVHGHTIAAAGAIELIITVNALREQFVPPTINWTAEDPRCRMDVVANTGRPHGFSAAMSNSFAFGGINTSLLVEMAAE